MDRLIHFKRFGWLLVISTGITFGGSAVAQSSSTDIEQDRESESLEEIVVLARRDFLPDANSTSTKLDRPLSETATSITVLDANVFEALGIDNYLEATKLVPGAVNAGSFGGTPNILSRGYDVSGTKINGVPTTSRPLDNIAVQSLEFVKGPPGVIFGEGNPGGFMNLITRKPGEDLRFTVSTEVGSWDHRRIAGSATGPITKSGKVKALLSASYQESESFVDFEERDSESFFAALSADLSDRIQLSVNGYYGDLDYRSYNDGWPAVIRRDDAGDVISTEFAFDVPWNRNTGQPWNSDSERIVFANAALEWALTDTLTFSARLHD